MESNLSSQVVFLYQGTLVYFFPKVEIKFIESYLSGNNGGKYHFPTSKYDYSSYMLWKISIVVEKESWDCTCNILVHCYVNEPKGKRSRFSNFSEELVL